MELEWARRNGHGKEKGWGWDPCSREAGPGVDRDGGGEMAKRERAANAGRVGKADPSK